MFGWAGLLAIAAFLGSCLALQCGAFRFFGFRACALWLVAGGFVLLLIVALVLLCADSARAISRIFRSPRFIPASFILSAAAIAGGIVALFNYAPPGEPILGEADQGIYLSSAIHLARTGSYKIDIPVLKITPAALRPWALGREPAEAQRRNGPAPRFWNYDVGFFLDPQPLDQVRDSTTPISSEATVNPQFPPGFPLLLAAAYEAGGWNGLIIVNRVLIVLAAALLGLIANRWLPVRGVIGLCVFLVALLQPLNVWVARSFFAEPSALCFWLLAILHWQYRRLIGNIFSGLLAGAFLAGGFYLKFDVLVALSVTALAVLFTSSFRFKAAFYLASAIVGLGALLAWRQFSWPNFYGNLSALAQSRMLLFLAAVGVLALAWKCWDANRVSRMLVPRRYSRFFLAAIILLLAAYAYWIRPNPSEANADYFFFWPIEGLLRSYREDTFFRLGWYWQPFGLALAVVGVAWLGFRRRLLWQKAFFWSGLISLFVLCYDLRNNPLQPYAMRRLLPAALPLLILGAAAFFPAVCEALLRFGRSRKPGAIMLKAGMMASIAGTAALLAGFAPINSRLNRQPKDGNFAGLVAQITKLAQAVPPRSIVVIRQNGLLATLATPLQLLEGIDALLVRPASHSTAYEEAFAQAWQEWTKHKYRVFLLSSSEQDRLDLFEVNLTAQARGTLRFPIISQSPVKLNTETVPIEWDYFLEEIQLPGAKTSTAP
jgi:hypothetical protein